MKITKEELANIIKEEVEEALIEQEKVPKERPDLPKNWRGLDVDDPKRVAFRKWYTTHGPGSKRKKPAAPAAKPAAPAAKPAAPAAKPAAPAAKPAAPAAKTAAAKNEMGDKIKKIAGAYNKMKAGREDLQSAIVGMSTLAMIGDDDANRDDAIINATDASKDKIDRETWGKAYTMVGQTLVSAMNDSAELNNIVIGMLEKLKQENPNAKSAKKPQAGRGVQIGRILKEQAKDIDGIIEQIQTAYRNMAVGRLEMERELLSLKYLADAGRIDAKKWKETYEYAKALVDQTNEAGSMSFAVIRELKKLKQGNQKDANPLSKYPAVNPYEDSDDSGSAASKQKVPTKKEFIKAALTRLKNGERGKGWWGEDAKFRGNLNLWKQKMGIKYDDNIKKLLFSPLQERNKGIKKMKITKEELANIIKEEVAKALSEKGPVDTGGFDENKIAMELSKAEAIMRSADEQMQNPEKRASLLKTSLELYQRACNLGSIKGCQAIPKVKKMIEKLN